MIEVKITRNTLGVTNELYKLIEGSAKRHSMFPEVIHLADDKISIAFKSVNTTKWRC